VDFRDTPEEAAFRQEVRDWLGANMPGGWNTPEWREPETLEATVAFHKDWSRRLHEAGYVGVTWPKRYGGREAPLTHQAIVLEELSRAEAPDHIGLIGVGMAGPTILAHGTDEQRDRFLANILTGEEVWCQGFSEPNAGSDLASLQTKAVPEGDGFVVSGQKVWSSFAHIADWCILLARTDGSGGKHAGLTYLLMDMHAPGVEVRPLRQITGESEFNEIFMDGVRIPGNRVVGPVGQGWQVAITTLMNERANVGFALLARTEVNLRRLVTLAKTTARNGSRAADDPLVRDKLADLWADVQAFRFTVYRAFSALLKTGVPGPEGSVAKLFWSEMAQRLTMTALEIEGTFAMLAPGSDRAVQDGRWQTLQLRSRGNTIEAGTSEILRNIIAERVLGLPKSAR
jgi:alkylation response protein AidB-like acyl-CoA dehydrogenase